MKICVLVPTYNEVDNIQSLITQILALGPEYEVLIVDDSSPDGTAQLVRELQASRSRLHLLLRKGPRGRGLAGADGFKKALELKASHIVEMDADFSHRPEEIPRLVEALKENPVAVGSRFVKGAKFDRPGMVRQIITSGAAWLIRLITGVQLRDPTSGFRAYRREVLDLLFATSPLIARGPAIVEEVLYKVHILGFQIEEVPITFLDRKRGKSTFNFKVALSTLFFTLLLPYLFGHLKGEFPHSKEFTSSSPEDRPPSSPSEAQSQRESALGKDKNQKGNHFPPSPL